MCIQPLQGQMFTIALGWRTNVSHVWTLWCVEATDTTFRFSRALPQRRAACPWPVPPDAMLRAGRKNIQGGWRLWPPSGGEAEAAMQVFHNSPHLVVDERLHALLVVDKRV